MFHLHHSAAQSEPQPSGATIRLASCQGRVAELKAALAALDEECRQFKQTHHARVSRFGMLLRVECDAVNGYAAIRAQWDVLLRRRDSLLTEWHAALHEFAAAKEAAK